MKLRKNNRGFTLVELIIVIAIIAVLSVVVTPQYLKYVEKARETVDENAMSELVHAAEVIILGGESVPVGTVRLTVEITADGVATIQEEGDLTDAVESILNPINYEFRSKLYKGKTIVITVTDGLVTWVKPTAG